MPDGSVDSIDDGDPNEILSNSSSFPLANLHGIPSMLVHGCVNVLTGDYLDFDTDLILAGSEPFALERHYCSSDKKKGSLGHGWSHTHWGYLHRTVLP